MRRVGACRATGGDDAITWKPSVEATARIQLEKSGFAGRTGAPINLGASPGGRRSPTRSPGALPQCGENAKTGAWRTDGPPAAGPIGQSASSPSLGPIRQRPADVSQPPAAAGGGDVREALRLQYAAILSIAEAVRARPPPAEALLPRRLGEDAVATHLRSEVAHLRYTVSRQNGELAWQQVDIPSPPHPSLPSPSFLFLPAPSPSWPFSPGRYYAASRGNGKCWSRAAVAATAAATAATAAATAAAAAAATATTTAAATAATAATAAATAATAAAAAAAAAAAGTATKAAATGTAAKAAATTGAAEAAATTGAAKATTAAAATAASTAAATVAAATAAAAAAAARSISD